MNGLNRLFGQRLQVVNVGLQFFSEPIAGAGAGVVDIAWRPPAEADPESALRVARLFQDQRVDAANQEAVARCLAVDPVLIDVMPARDALALGERTLLHSGPPVTWERMAGPMRGAVVGAALFEGWAATPDEAERLAVRGELALSPAHSAGAVGPMAGVISPSMPLWVVRDNATGRKAYCNLNEGLGKVLRFGAYDDEVISRLQWMATDLAPTLRAALARRPEGLSLRPLIAQALMMGDECHNRNEAASALMLRTLAPGLASEGASGVRALEFMAGNGHFFLNVSMAACKLIMSAAEGVVGSSLVTAMARNGVDFGIRLAGLGDRWFVAPSPVADGLYFPGHGADEANPDLGDSSITETAGLGAFAMAAAPAIVGFVGGSAADATRYTVEMMRVTLASSPDWKLPALDFRGTPMGIDARLVADTNTCPVMNTGIASRTAGVGQIGAGIARAPMACFLEALKALEETL